MKRIKFNGSLPIAGFFLLGILTFLCHFRSTLIFLVHENHEVWVIKLKTDMFLFHHLRSILCRKRDCFRPGFE